MTAVQTCLENSAAIQFAADVRAGLTRHDQKQLSPKYLYDAVGSALFEAISVLPEYGLTRADERLLRRHSNEIANWCLSPSWLPNSAAGAAARRVTFSNLCGHSAQTAIPYYPIEISTAALTSCERSLADLPGVSVRTVESEYLAGLRNISKQRRRGTHLFVLFLGSSIGNFEAGEDRQFLTDVRETLLPGDSLLLGADLTKPLDRLLAAYDDPAGVTAAFNLNLLSRINRELGADFDLRSFEHVARFNSHTSSVEMHLRSKHRQSVTIARAECMAHFAEGETIWTESSHKYSPQELLTLAHNSGFRCHSQWIDEEWCFAENLFFV